MTSSPGPLARTVGDDFVLLSHACPEPWGLRPRNKEQRFALELLKRQLALPRRLAFEQARTAESMMHQVCFAAPETQQRIRENYIQDGDGHDNADD